MKRARLATRIFDVPLLVERQAAEAFVSALADDFEIQPFMSIEERQSFARPERSPAIYDEYGGVAVVPIIGELAHRATAMDSMSGSVGYAGLQSRLLAMAEDPRVRGMLLDLDTPGGEVGGLAELSIALADISKRMPVWAIANSLAASAGYWIAASADRVLATPFSRTGSIGVVMLHVDASKAIEKRGFVTTFVHAGKHKIDGNGLQPLSDQARASMIATVGEVYDQFVEHVSSTRRMKPDAVRSTEARVYGAKEALEVGLVDGISTLSDAIGRMKTAIQDRTRASTVRGMRIETVQGSNMKTYEDGITEGKAQGVTEGRAAATSDLQASHAKTLASEISAAALNATAAAVTAERARIKAITGSPEAKGREEMAAHLAFNTDMTAEAAEGMLKVAPKSAKGAQPPKTQTPASDPNAAAGSILAHLREHSPQVSSEEDGGAATEDARRQELRGTMKSVNSLRGGARPQA